MVAAIVHRLGRAFKPRKAAVQNWNAVLRYMPVNRVERVALTGKMAGEAVLIFGHDMNREPLSTGNGGVAQIVVNVVVNPINDPPQIAQGNAVAITMSEDRVFDVDDSECVACNLCVNVCPVEGCITMEQLAPGVMDERTGKVVEEDYANWTTHPNNPGSCAAE